MILSFKSEFKFKIISGSKIHTIREDRFDRWRVGMQIHFATGLRTKRYSQFKSGICYGIQKIRIRHRGGKYMSLTFDNETGLWIDDKLMFTITGMIHNGTDFMERFAKHDGFPNYSDFFRWFNSDFDGKIIHWTDYKY